MEAARTTTVKPKEAIGPDWDTERLKEIKKLMDYGVVIVTDRDPQARTLDMVWVYTDRTPVGGEKNLKARLCVRGDQERSTAIQEGGSSIKSYHDTDSPTSGREAQSRQGEKRSAILCHCGEQEMEEISS